MEIKTNFAPNNIGLAHELARMAVEHFRNIDNVIAYYKWAKINAPQVIIPEWAQEMM